MWLPDSLNGMPLTSGFVQILARHVRCSLVHINRSVHHFELFQRYREERQRQLAVAEEESLGYSTELQEYTEKHPLITFRDWLIYQRRAA